MGDHSKREQRRQHEVEAMENPPVLFNSMPRCDLCPAEARYDVTTKEAEHFYCAEHLRPDALERP